MIRSSEDQVKALLFDLGGVVMEIVFDNAVGHWQRLSRLTADEIRGRFRFDEPYKQHERGEIGARDYFGHLRECLELEGSDSEIEHGWNSILEGRIQTTLEHIVSARNKLPCYALTNTNPTHQAFWSTAHPEVVAAFDRIFVSSELGMRKPDRAVFHRVARETGMELSSFLFFDDTMENVIGARAAGMQAVQVKGPSDVVQALVAIGVGPEIAR